MKKTIIASVIVGILSISIPTFAHVVVKPSSVETGAFQTFTVGVPVENQLPTTGLRLVIPTGLLHVTPTVKPGWKIDIKKEGENITEIIWTGSSIPAGQRDEFSFSAQVPQTESEIAWKAYQTYSNGEIVAWDQSTGGNPYSITTVTPALQETPETTTTHNSTATTFSIVSLVFSIIALGLARKNSKQ